MMKTYSGIYEKLCSHDNLLLAYKKARKRKSDRWYVKEFECNLESELLQLKHELETMTYKPRPLRQFVIRDLKTRLISSSHFRDRVVHHALCNIIEPIFDKTFICDSYANRKGKGTHAALKRFDKFKRKVSGNGALLQEAKDNNMVYGYVLKADIRHYFDSVDHEVLISIIKRRIKDEKIIWLIEEIVHNHNCKVPDKGMPLGNLTSQFFANVYLNELDQFVKHELKARFYIRYVDDFVILDISAKRLDIYKRKTYTTLAQQYGRVMRSDEDWGYTLIADGKSVIDITYLLRSGRDRKDANMEYMLNSIPTRLSCGKMVYLNPSFAINY